MWIWKQNRQKKNYFTYVSCLSVLKKQIFWRKEIVNFNVMGEDVNDMAVNGYCYNGFRKHIH